MRAGHGVVVLVDHEVRSGGILQTCGEEGAVGRDGETGRPGRKRGRGVSGEEGDEVGEVVCYLEAARFDGCRGGEAWGRGGGGGGRCGVVVFGRKMLTFALQGRWADGPVLVALLDERVGDQGWTGGRGVRG